MTKISNQYSLTNILTADLANSRLGINNVSPAYSLDLTGTARVSGISTFSSNVGVGVVPQTWYSTVKAIQFSVGGALWGIGASNNIFSANEYLDSTGTSKYISTDFATRYQQNAGTHVWSYASSGTAGNNITFTESTRINALGFVKANNAGTYRSGVANRGHEFSNDTSENINHFTIYCSSASTAGNLLRVVSDRNTTNGTYNLIQASGPINEFIVRDSGNCVNTNNSYGAISDIKLKENIVDTSPKLEDLLKVKIRNYNLKSNPDLKQIGVIAQELEDIFPSMIEETLDDKTNQITKSVKYSIFVPILIKAIQELSAKVSLLENK